MRIKVLIAFMLGMLAVDSHALPIGMEPYNEALDLGYTGVPVVSNSNIDHQILASNQEKPAIKLFCSRLEEYFRKYSWTGAPCGGINWRAEFQSKNGHPLIYASFGEGSETTLLLSGVHPDELTPVPLAFQFARHLQEHPGTLDYSRSRVVIAPLVNPDGFLRNVPTRTNANGIDLNRNFFTMDWYERSKKWWQSMRARSPKHFPGYFPNSEIETLFQIQLVADFQPDKILSIHAPLGFLDYDGPGDRKPNFLLPGEKKAKELVLSISEKSSNYRVVDYSFYPGSLGNFAGNERNIPTVTLELETTNPKMVDAYWQRFLPGLIQAVNYQFKSQSSTTAGGNASVFYSRDMLHTQRSVK